MDLVELLNREFKGKCSGDSYHLDYQKLANYLIANGYRFSQFYNEGYSMAETISNYPEIFFEENCFYDAFYNNDLDNKKLENGCIVMLMADALGIDYEYYETTFFYDYDYEDEVMQSEDYDPSFMRNKRGYIEVYNDNQAEFIINWCKDFEIPYEDERDKNQIVVYGFTEDNYFEINYFDYVDEDGNEKTEGMILDCTCGNYGDPEDYGIMDVIKSFDKNNKFFSIDEDAKMAGLINTFSEIISDTKEVVF